MPSPTNNPGRTNATTLVPTGEATTAPVSIVASAALSKAIGVLGWYAKPNPQDVEVERIIPIASLPERSLQDSDGIDALPLTGDYSVIVRNRANGERSSFGLLPQVSTGQWAVSDVAAHSAAVLDEFAPAVKIVQVPIAYDGMLVDWWAVETTSGATYAIPIGLVVDHTDPVLGGEALMPDSKHPLSALSQPIVY